MREAKRVPRDREPDLVFSIVVRSAANRKEGDQIIDGDSGSVFKGCFQIAFESQELCLVGQHSAGAVAERDQQIDCCGFCREIAGDESGTLTVTRIKLCSILKFQEWYHSMLHIHYTRHKGQGPGGIPEEPG